MLLMLGSTFQFSISSMTFEELQRSRSWRWAEQPIVGRHPKLQFLGANSETIVLRGTRYPGQLHSPGRIPNIALVKMAELSGKFNQPLPLVAGGRIALFMGFWVIEEFNVVETHFLRGGSVPRKEVFDIALRMAKPPPSTLLQRLQR